MKESSFLTVCMNQTIQKTLVFHDELVMDTVNRTSEYRLDASGKGVNVCRVLSQAGKRVCHLTQLGGSLRPLFLDLCRSDDLDIRWVESGSPIRFCYTLINKKDGSVTELVEESEEVGEGTAERLLEAFSSLAPSFSTVTISGTMAAGFPDTLIPDMVRMAKAGGCRVILDIRGKDLLNSLHLCPDLVKPNLYEFASTFAPDLVANNSVISDTGKVKKMVQEIWEELHRKYPCSLVLTRGAAPVWYAENGMLKEYAFESIVPVNTIGSGDTFTAGIAAALEEGASLAEAVEQGVRLGMLNASLLRPGVIRNS